MSEVTYRPATEHDFPVLMDMYTQLNEFFYTVGYRLPKPEDVGQVWLDSFKRTLGNFSNVFVGEVDGELAGFILCRLKRVPAHMGGMLVGEISDIWINAGARRIGIGDKLSRLALDWLRQHGAHSVEVQILMDNDASRRFFERMGFKMEFRVERLLWDDYLEETSFDKST
ncbi:MAG: GNAT family N-acetyltransferase [Anaerolineales bacterium]|jgi:putative acetyltransferase